MERSDYFTGGPPVEESVASLSDPNDHSDQFAFNAAQAYNYAPLNKTQPAFMQTQQNYQLNGFMNPPQQPFMGAPMNIPYNPQMLGNAWQRQTQQMQYQTPPFGFVGSPYMQPNMYTNQFGLTQPVGYYNPYAQQAVMFQQQPQVYQDRVVHIPGYNPSGNEGMLTSDAEQICDKLQVDMMFAQEAAIAKREYKMQQYYNNNYGGYSMYGYNYYGMPYYNNYYDQSIYNEYIQKIRDMADQARARRLEFNKNLSRLCHNYLGDNTTDEYINSIYEGQTYTIPGSQIQKDEHYSRLCRMVPVNNASYYQKLDAQVSAMYKSIAPDTGDMNQWLNNCGLLILEDKLEESYHNKRNLQNQFNTDTFHRQLRRYAIEHEVSDKEKELDANQKKVLEEVKNGDFTNLPTNRMDGIRFLFGEETAAKFADLERRWAAGPPRDDNPQPIQQVGPQDANGTPVVITDREEQEFEMRRHAFLESIYNKQSYAEQNIIQGVT